MAVRVLLTFILSVLSLASLAADFSGKYEAESEGSKYTLSLTQAGNNLTGEATGDGMTFKLKGTVSGDSATGTVTPEGIEVALHFKASLSGNKLKMTIAVPGDDGKADWSDADDYNFTRTGDAPKEQKEDKKEKALARFSKQPTGVLKNGKEYTHASGGKFRYPGDWKLHELDQGLQLLPPDAGQDEIYAVLAEEAGGATDASTPEVVAYLDSQVRQVHPFVKRVGEVEKANAGNGKGAVITWEGKKDGKDYRVRGYVTILKNYGVALVSAGPVEKLEKRDKVLREIFHTFGWGQGKLDNQLVGTWNHWSYKGGASSGRETRARVVLQANGTFSYETNTESSMSAQGRDSGGNVTWTGGMAGRSGNGWNGTWTADGSNLILNFEDGTTETFTYTWKQEGANTFLIVKEEGGKTTEWSRG